MLLAAVAKPKEEPIEPVRGPRDEADDSEPGFMWKREAGEFRLTSICADRRWYKSGFPPVVGRSSRAASGGGEEARRLRPPFGHGWYSSEPAGLRSLMFKSRIPFSSMPNSWSEKMLWS